MALLGFSVMFLNIFKDLNSLRSHVLNFKELTWHLRAVVPCSSICSMTQTAYAAVCWSSESWHGCMTTDNMCMHFALFEMLTLMLHWCYLSYAGVILMLALHACMTTDNLCMYFTLFEILTLILLHVNGGQNTKSVYFCIMWVRPFMNKQWSEDH